MGAAFVATGAGGVGLLEEKKKYPAAAAAITMTTIGTIFMADELDERGDSGLAGMVNAS